MDLEDHEEEDMKIVEPKGPSNYIHKTHPLPRLTIKNPSPVHSNRLHLPSKPMIYNYNYKECLKNHAVAIGGHALDGCGEFMPGGPHGSLDALKCAACNCHRNFHRRDITDDGDGDSGSQYIPYWRGGRMLTLPSQVLVRKRVRTKFTEEQKEKMVEMAEKLDWRIQKKDKATVMEFCNEIGVKRRVLKVWMHNNKNMFRKESQQNIFS